MLAVGRPGLRYWLGARGGATPAGHLLPVASRFMSDTPTPTPTPNIHLLRCLACGNTVECRPADLLRFTRTGWLRCCGEVMTLFAPADKPTPPARPGLA
jgi:hypothetical protein